VSVPVRVRAASTTQATERTPQSARTRLHVAVQLLDERARLVPDQQVDAVRGKRSI
jgi:hypothetical protein